MKRLSTTMIVATFISIVLFAYPPCQAQTQQGDRAASNSQSRSLWAGTWETSSGKMILVAGPGKTFRGSFDWHKGGRIIGSVDGPRRLVAYWIHSESNTPRCVTERDGSYYWGRWVFTFNSDWSAFEGLVSSCDVEPSGAWSGKRSSGAARPVGEKLPDLNGEWIGEGYTCDGPEKPERIRIEHVANTVTAVKITGDRCIAAGQLTFTGTFTMNPFQARMQVGAAGASKFFIFTTVHVESADLIKLSGSGDPVILRRASKGKVVQLSFVRQAGAGFEPINRNDRGFAELVYNQPFYIEALFDTPPAEIRKEIRLEWAVGQTRNIVVTKTEKDPRVFRSEVLFVKAPQ